MFSALYSSVSTSVHGTVARFNRKLAACALLLVAAGFFVAAAFVYVHRFYDADIVAAAFGAVFLVLALLLFIVNALAARAARRRRAAVAAAALANPVAVAGLAKMAAGRNALPLLSLGAAAAVGLALSGALSGKRDRS